MRRRVDAHVSPPSPPLRKCLPDSTFKGVGSGDATTSDLLSNPWQLRRTGEIPTAILADANLAANVFWSPSVPDEAV